MSSKDITADTEKLDSYKSFRELPELTRHWIAESELARSEALEFFGMGGSIKPEVSVHLPYYHPTSPPVIYVNKSTHELLNGRNAGLYYEVERSFFSTFAHEIGHVRHNSENTLFRGGTAEEYVAYRGEIEARAIFSAFEVFKELETVGSSFKPKFDHVGYLAMGLEAAKLYKEWANGADSQPIIEQMASQVPNCPYEHGGATDIDKNGVITHRDKFLVEYQKMIDLHPEMAFPQAPAQTFELDSVDRLINALSTGDESALRAARVAYFKSEDGQQLLKDTAEYRQDRLHDAQTHHKSVGLTLGADGHSIGSLTGRRDPRDWDHLDHALYSAIRRDLPAEFSDETAARVMLEAKQQRILRPHEIDGIHVHNGHAFVAGKHFQTAHVDLSQNPPPMQDTVQQSQLLDQQLALERAQWLAQQQELARSGPSMGL